MYFILPIDLVKLSILWDLRLCKGSNLYTFLSFQATHQKRVTQTHFNPHHSRHPKMVSTVMLEPLTATSIPEGMKKAVPTNQRTNCDAHGELSTSHNIVDRGGSTTDLSNRPIDSTYNVTPETVTIKPQVYVTPALCKTPSTYTYLASGKESDRNSIYVPQSQGSRTSNHGSHPMTEIPLTTDEPNSMGMGHPIWRRNPPEVPMSLKDQELCYWAKYGVQRESRWTQI
jgi:hypothetical protein